MANGSLSRVGLEYKEMIGLNTEENITKSSEIPIEKQARVITYQLAGEFDVSQ